MSGKKSILGNNQDRIRTHVRLPPELVSQVSYLCKRLGVPMNAFYTVAALNQILIWKPLLKVEKRDIITKELTKLLQKVTENNT